MRICAAHKLPSRQKVLHDVLIVGYDSSHSVFAMLGCVRQRDSPSQDIVHHGLYVGHGSRRDILKRTRHLLALPQAAFSADVRSRFN